MSGVGCNTLPHYKRSFSATLADTFESGLQRELLEFLCGNRLGNGMSREVFEFLPAPHLVIKWEPVEHRFQNVEEFTVWQTVEHTKYAKWFAPCHAISGCGRIMLQHYAEPLAAINLPAEVPAFFTDLKPSNWGQINGQPVALDYGRTLLMSKGLTSRMHRADWT
jgi:hypothetical protein